MGMTALPLLFDLVALCLAALLIASGVHKITAGDRMRRVVVRFVGAPVDFAAAFVSAFSAVELATGVGLALPATRVPASIVAAVLWAGYLLFIGRAIVSGRSGVDCGCSFGSHASKPGKGAVIRNILLVSAASMVAMNGSASAAFQPLFIPAALAFLALYVAAEQIAALSVYRTR